jgi:flagellar basal-body rod modification protein FlgD
MTLVSSLTAPSAPSAPSAPVYRATATSTATSTAAATGTDPASGSSPSDAAKDQWGKDTFLKLLCAQLQYQDPSNPADGTQFLAQTAQFTVVEKLGELNSLNEKLLATIQSQLSASQAQEAAALVGRTVTWTDADDVSHSGVVSAANLGTPPTLTVGTETVELSAITAVTTTPTGSGSQGTVA